MLSLCFCQSYEHLIAQAAAQKIANPEVPLAAYDAGFSTYKPSTNTTQTALCLSNLPFKITEEEIMMLFDRVVSLVNPMNASIGFIDEQRNMTQPTVRGDGPSGNFSRPPPPHNPEQASSWSSYSDRPPMNDTRPPYNNYGQDRGGFQGPPRRGCESSSSINR
ncbi:hypothetical protein Ciccas_009521 [Cichlidogyrus casuarinus]|uniref:RRM domain-containing protein n=1 Tax=Cichlidogyrus casuarinus TaxID=1844966 RepID=A0ABD2PWT0_9PLAT